MSLLTDLIIVFLGFAGLYGASSLAVRTYRRYRGTRLVTCPETSEPAAVSVDATHAALTAAFGGKELRLTTCSRWPERKGCGQECIRQIETASEGCLVREVARVWYAGKRCVLCRKSAGEIRWLEHPLALMAPDGSTTFWKNIPAEDLPRVLASHRPVCWNCHIAESFRSLHPDLVVDRPAMVAHRAH